MKILWHSNAPWAGTGYGQQTRIFTPKIRDAGVDVAISAPYGFSGTSTNWEGITVYPSGYDAYGNDVIAWYAADHFKGDRNDGWVVILYDAWVFGIDSLRQFHNAVWVPVDHDPIPPNVLAYFHKYMGLPIAMSKFGVEKFAEQNIEALHVPHAFDEFYEPKPKADGRQALQLPEDAFVVGMNMANKGGDMHRKAFGQQLEAFANLVKKHDDAVLYVHAEQYGIGNGWNLDRLADMLDIRDRVRFVDQFTYRLSVPAEHMPWMYSAFDVLLNATMGEGFGIPIIESQACGTPVIVTDWTAMPELVGGGWIVGGDRQWHESMSSWWKIPSIGEMSDALEAAYDDRSDTGDRARQYVQQYRADVVFENHWLSVLANMAERINPLAVAA